MAKTSVITARIDEETKTHAQELLSTAGLSCSQAIQGLFSYIVRLGRAPDFVLDTYLYEPPKPRTDDTFSELNRWIARAPWSALDFTGITDAELEEGKLDALAEGFRDDASDGSSL